MTDLSVKTAACDRLFHLGSAEWEVDLDAGRISFRHDGLLAEADVQVVGTYNKLDGTFLWGWDHPSVPPGRDQDAARVRRYGEGRGLTELTERKVTCDEATCWEFTALASFLGDAQCAYRGPTGDTLVFFTFADVNLKRESSA